MDNIELYVFLILMGLFWLAAVTMCRPYRNRQSNRSAVLAASCLVVLTAVSELIYNNSRTSELSGYSGMLLYVTTVIAALTPVVSLLLMYYIVSRQRKAEAKENEAAGKDASSFEMSLVSPSGEKTDAAGGSARADDTPYRLMEDGKSSPS
jgi:uncharacterized membrane protein